MSSKRKLTISAITVGIMASHIATFIDAASAQQPQPATHEGRRGIAKPSPQQPRVVVTPTARPARPQIAAPAPRHVAPPPVRYAAPAPRPHHEEPRRSLNWRPWGYGAAAAGAVIVGSRWMRTRPSDAEACANDFDSFDWDSGTIVNDDGDRQLCPYLE